MKNLKKPVLESFEFIYSYDAPIVKFDEDLKCYVTDVSEVINFKEILDYLNCCGVNDEDLIRENAELKKDLMASDEIIAHLKRKIESMQREA